MDAEQWLSRLISFDTTSRNSNLNLIQDVAEWCSKQGVDARYSYDATKRKANLLITIPAQTQTPAGGLILSGHTDVVPVDGQVWDGAPFRAQKHEDRIYGRGACDMKGFLAVALSLVPEFSRSKLRHPVHLALSYDEEVGCLGAPGLIADLKSAGFKPAGCIVGEPTEMRPVTGHKGINGVICKIHGRAAHSSLTPHGCNAIEHAAQLISYLRSVAEGFRADGPFDTAYDIPFTTLSTNLVRGGIAQNTIPALCELMFEFRNLVGVAPEEILERISDHVRTVLEPRLRAEHDSASIEVERGASVPGFAGDERAAIVQLLRKITGESALVKVPYATEAGIFQNAQIPTVVCGPGSIAQAHRENEYVEITQLQRCVDVVRLAVAQTCG